MQAHPGMQEHELHLQVYLSTQKPNPYALFDTFSYRCGILAWMCFHTRLGTLAREREGHACGDGIDVHVRSTPQVLRPHSSVQ